MVAASMLSTKTKSSCSDVIDLWESLQMCMKFWDWIGRKLGTLQSLIANTMLPIYEIAIVAFQLLCQIGLLFPLD